MSTEIKNLDEIVRFLSSCDICRIAFHDGEYPYVIPLNFGFKVFKGELSLYFKGLLKGKKYDLIEKNNHVGFEVDSSTKTITGDTDADFTMEYESVSGYGIIEELDSFDKVEALEIIRNQYIHGSNVTFVDFTMENTRAFEIEVKGITWRRSVKKNVLIR